MIMEVGFGRHARKGEHPHGGDATINFYQSFGAIASISWTKIYIIFPSLGRGLASPWPTPAW